MKPFEVRILRASSFSEFEALRSLFQEYAAWLGIDLGFQDFKEELTTLPGRYAAPKGALFLASDGEGYLGCAGIRPFEWPKIAELKRLWVKPQGRGRGLGSLLCQFALSYAQEAGYERVRLDTLPTMTAARLLYESLGFYEIDAYRINPIPGARYMELKL